MADRIYRFPYNEFRLSAPLDNADFQALRDADLSVATLTANTNTVSVGSIDVRCYQLNDLVRAPVTHNLGTQAIDVPLMGGDAVEEATGKQTVELSVDFYASNDANATGPLIVDDPRGARLVYFTPTDNRAYCLLVEVASVSQQQAGEDGAYYTVAFRNQGSKYVKPKVI